jgi:hypothetical protein
MGRRRAVIGQHHAGRQQEARLLAAGGDLHVQPRSRPWIALRSELDHSGPKPHGTYGMDLRCDEHGIVRPTECNAGRFKTTSLMLARAGCNMPWYFVKLATVGAEAFFALKDCIPQYNPVPEGLLYIRHMDCDTVMISEDKLRSIPLTVVGRHALVQCDEE